MREVEVKILGINKGEVEKRLISLGAKRVFEGKVESHFFDVANKALKKAGKTLRLRKENNKFILTFKEKVPDNQVKIRNEYEVEVSDFEIAKKIVESLGLEEYDCLKKTRTSYALEGAHFEIDKYLDEYEFIPAFLEIEAEDKNRIYKYAEMLGFRKEECTPWTFTDLVKHYKNNKNAKAQKT